MSPKKRLLKNILMILLLAGAAIALIEFPYIQTSFELKFFPQTDTAAINIPRMTLSANMLYIPSLDITAPVQFPKSDEENTLQQALQTGVAHYPGSVPAGQTGNCYIAGHSSDYAWSRGDYKTVFSTLPKIKIGDKIFISDDNSTYTYITKTLRIANSDDFSATADPGTGKSLLTLQTSYPIGTALRRFIVVAEMK